MSNVNGRQVQLEDFMTAGRLKEILKDFPDDAPVFIERVEDQYFTVPNSEMEALSVKKPGVEYPEYETQYIQAYGVVVYRQDDCIYITPSYLNAKVDLTKPDQPFVKTGRQQLVL